MKMDCGEHNYIQYKNSCDISCCSGKPLELFLPRTNNESFVWLRVMNSGMVIMKKIGQPACLQPNVDIDDDHGWAPETERIWVSVEGSNQPCS